MSLTLSDIERARDRIAGHVRLTPVIAWQPPPSSLWLKLEQLQVGGSFKARGACNRLLSASADELGRGVVTASGGNHGLGVAYAATRRVVAATVFLPDRAPVSTERQLARMGARIERGGAAWDDAWVRAERFAAETGALLVHPFEDWDVIAGQGTIGLELLEQIPDFAQVVVAIGGGGLIAGIALAIKTARPRVRIIGVEPTGATSMKQSVLAGRLVELESVSTIAGTLAPRTVGPHTLDLVSRYVDDIVLVEDAEMKMAMRRLWSEMRVLVEPAGAAAVAAVLTERIGIASGPTVAVVCGANLDAELIASTVD